MLKKLSAESKAVPKRKLRAAQGTVANPTGVYTSDDGGRYYVRQIGNTIWWAGLGNGGTGDNFTNVFRGTRTGNVVSGTWVDVPRGTNTGSGTLSFQISLDPTTQRVTFTRRSATGGFGATFWQFDIPQGLRRPARRRVKRKR
ncbi:hypothetical protein [Thermoactinomyces sp. CICC 10522]|jgi:hypothetical protein|uniref:hypothetical protein n=1 Tax=Thermoactinomyces sp. CICC 10522 TaxID=2767427 RepID=UPI00068AED63|nr:hypothetical protein [Thermoactinomyces sp. CICC 10522]